MAQDDNNLLISDIQTGAMLPTASSLTFSTTQLLRMADRELQSGVVPLMMSVREEYFVTYLQQAIQTNVALQQIRLPYRAIGQKVRQMNLVPDALGDYWPIPQLSVDDRESNLAGYWVEGNLVWLFNPMGNWVAPTIELVYYLRPNRLVSPSTAVGVITAVNGTTFQLTVAAAPATFTSTALYDVVRARPGYDCLMMDAAATVAGNVLTFNSLENEIAVGDYVCLAEESPVAQIPPEMHPVLAQRVIVKVLEAVGDTQGMQAAQSKLAELQESALTLITPRNDGSQKRFANRSSPFRRRRRWLLY